MSYISAGGGAFLEYVEGKVLSGAIAILEKCAKNKWDRFSGHQTRNPALQVVSTPPGTVCGAGFFKRNLERALQISL